MWTRCTTKNFENKRDGKNIKKKVSGSNKCGCIFSLKGQQMSVHGDHCTLKVVCEIHNHPAEKYLKDHSDI